MSFFECRDGGYTAFINGSNIVVRRFAWSAEEERISSRGGGGLHGEDGCNGLPGGVCRLSDRLIRKFDISVVRKLR
jgi:hypothetical protein